MMTAKAAAWVGNRVPLRDTSPAVVLPRLTVVLVVMTSARSTNRLLFGLGLAVVVFGVDRLGRSGWLWLAVGIVFNAWNLLDWHVIDNHLVLAGYWYLALGAALLADDPAHQLRINARLLIGVAFAIAVTRKLVNPELVSGDFFVFTLLSDPRFEPAATIVGRAPELIANRVALGHLPRPATLVSGGGIRVLAQTLTWSALLVESAVAVFNLLPAAQWRRAGQIALAAFITLTYVIVPVVAFGAVLLVMGAASAASDRSRVAWTIGFFALAAWGYAWQAVVL